MAHDRPWAVAVPLAAAARPLPGGRPSFTLSFLLSENSMPRPHGRALSTCHQAGHPAHLCPDEGDRKKEKGIWGTEHHNNGRLLNLPAPT